MHWIVSQTQWFQTTFILRFALFRDITQHTVVNSIYMFRDNQLVPPSMVKKSMSFWKISDFQSNNDEDSSVLRYNIKLVHKCLPMICRSQLPPSSESTEIKKGYSSWVACTLQIQATQNIGNYLLPYTVP